MTELFILWITVSIVGDTPYSFQLEKPFATEKICNSKGRRIAAYMHKDLEKQFPERVYIFMLECEPYETAVV